jgi:hypothetical protein
VSRRTASLLAWSSAALGVVLVTAGASLAAAGGSDSELFFGLVFVLVLSTSVVGGLVASRPHAAAGETLFPGCRSSGWPWRPCSPRSSRLRREVELDELRADLEDVVSVTMQPSHVSIWLRNEESVPSA